MEETHRPYLRDLGCLVRAAAEEAARRAKEADGGPDTAFEAGRLLAYREVTSLMLQQARTFGLSASDLAMDGLDPDRDLRKA